MWAHDSLQQLCNYQANCQQSYCAPKSHLLSFTNLGVSDPCIKKLKKLTTMNSELDWLSD